MTYLRSSASCQQVTVSIVSFSESRDQLKTTLRSVFVALKEAQRDFSLSSARIILIDNRSKNMLDTEFLESFSSAPDYQGIALSLIQGHGNIGYGRAQNMALDEADEGYQIIMNPDVEVEPEAIRLGLAYLDANPTVGLISPAAFDSCGNKQYLCKRYPTIFDLFVRAFFPSCLKSMFVKRLHHYEMRHLSESTPSNSIPIASGCFMFMRKSVFSKVGGFDPRFFLYFEDFDLSLRLRAFTQIAYVPEMKITHWGGNAAKKGASHFCMFVASGIRFYNRHGWRWYQQN